MIKNIKLIIWGLGTNGKNLIDVLHSEDIIAIIDSNPDKLAMKTYQNIPIIDFNTYLKESEDAFIVITAMKYHNIVKQLEKHQKTKYFILNEAKVALAALGLIKSNQFIDKCYLDKNANYYISGINLFSVYLYNYLLEYKIKADFITYNKDQQEMLDSLIEANIIRHDPVKNNNMRKSFLIKTDDLVVEGNEEIDIIDYKLINETIYQPWKKDLLKFKNRHKGKRAFIIATGPSIKTEDLEKLEKRNELAISMNGIIYFLDRTTWRPDYYVISDGEMIRLYEEAEKAEDYLKHTEKFFSDNYLRFWEKQHDSTYHGFRQIQKPYEIKFSSDFSDRVYAGYSVVYACIQLAVYMGIEEIYLLGCDFSFSNDLKDKSNHCYGEDFEFYTFDFEGVLNGYRCAKNYAEENNIKIYNATRGGKLELFERVDFDSLFNEK